MSRLICITALFALAATTIAHAAGAPFDGKTFRGRIAYSADGNFNDPDDWIASPVALAIFAQVGVKDRLVHFGYNDIQPRNNPEWQKIHAESVLGAAQRYGHDLSKFFDCQMNVEGAVQNITRAINASSAEDPLYFIVAGPMEVAYRGIQKSDANKRKFVYCISHSRWNDGFAKKEVAGLFTYNKRSVIESGVHWIQIQDQNRLLSFGRYGTPAKPEEFHPYFWMRDSKDPNVRFLWERMLVSTRPDPSDAGMAWFLVTGDEEATPEKLKQLLDNKSPVQPVTARKSVRVEAENFQTLTGCELEDREDRTASHRLNIVRKRDQSQGSIRTRVDQPYATNGGHFNVAVRYFADSTEPFEFTLLINDKPAGPPFKTPVGEKAWATHLIRNVAIEAGNEIGLEMKGFGRIDYVQLDTRADGQAGSEPTAKRFLVTQELDDPAALPGQIIVKGSKPGYLKYNGGSVAYLCGPDNPEDFFFLGTLNPDGTRSNGAQQQIIDRMAKAGVSAYHVLMFRMRRCNIKDEGDDQHSPFVDFDPAKPLNEKMLDQWEGWLKQMEKHGIVVHFEFYNDATDVEKMGWTLDASGNLHPDEEKFFAGIVKRFKHLKNIVWGIGESVNKLPRARTPHFMKLSELIARVDNHHHPIVQSFVTPDTSERDIGPDKIMSDEYIRDPNIHVITWLHALPHGQDYEAQHQEYLKYARMNNDRFIVMKNETEKFPQNLTQSRRYMWSCVMTGMHCLESGHNAVRTPRLLDDDGRIATFMEQTDFYAMRSHDELAAGSTNWVLANPGKSYIAYSYNAGGPMGLKEIPAGDYEFTWLDTISGQMVKQTVSVTSGKTNWDKPASFGNEVAVYIKRKNAAQ